MDADMVALRAPDELFNLPEPFSAAPDIGWPDLFNTGLMVLDPNMGDYYALLAMAVRGISFDGADQGLLNMHFKNSFNRLSFTYNVTPSAHYQYIPAYRHFQSSISAAHFIGKDKPWTQGRDASRAPGPHNELAGRWWAVYDRHYRQAVCSPVPLADTPTNVHIDCYDSWSRTGSTGNHTTSCQRRISASVLWLLQQSVF
jgi:glycogenin glucosyltransferase